MTCDDEIAIAVVGGVLVWPTMLFAFLFWELYVANAIDRFRVRLASVIRGRL